MEKLDVLKLTAVTGAALFTGGAIYINVVEMPAIFTTKDTVSIRKFWAEMFNRARKVLGGLKTLAIVTGGITYYFDESEYKNLWAVGAGCLVTSMLWTKFVMMPDIKKLLMENVIHERGEKWVQDNIRAWNRRHMYRSFVGAISFGAFLYGLYASK